VHDVSLDLSSSPKKFQMSFIRAMDERWLFDQHNFHHLPFLSRNRSA